MSDAATDKLVPLQRRLIAALVVAVITTALGGAFMIVVEPNEETVFRIIGTLVLISGALALNVVFVAVLRRERAELVRLLTFMGVAITPAATIPLILALLGQCDLDFTQDGQGLTRAGLTGLAVAGGIAYTVALLQARHKPGMIRGMALATVISAWTVAGATITVTVGYYYIDNYGGFGFAIAMLIVVTIAAYSLLSARSLCPLPSPAKRPRRSRPANPSMFASGLNSAAPRAANDNRCDPASTAARVAEAACSSKSKSRVANAATCCTN